MANIIAKIACPGALADHLVIDVVRTECGAVKDGIGVYFEGNGGARPEYAWSTPTGAGFVLSWPEFEAAYLKVKALREAGGKGPSPSESEGKP